MKTTTILLMMIYAFGISSNIFIMNKEPLMVIRTLDKNNIVIDSVVEQKHMSLMLHQMSLNQMSSNNNIQIDFLKQ